MNKRFTKWLFLAASVAGLYMMLEYLVLILEGEQTTKNYVVTIVWGFLAFVWLFLFMLAFKRDKMKKEG